MPDNCNIYEVHISRVKYGVSGLVVVRVIRTKLRDGRYNRVVPVPRGRGPQQARLQGVSRLSSGLLELV